MNTENNNQVVVTNIISEFCDRINIQSIWTNESDLEFFRNQILGEIQETCVKHLQEINPDNNPVSEQDRHETLVMALRIFNLICFDMIRGEVDLEELAPEKILFKIGDRVELIADARSVDNPMPVGSIGTIKTIEVYDSNLHAHHKNSCSGEAYTSISVEYDDYVPDSTPSNNLNVWWCGHENLKLISRPTE